MTTITALRTIGAATATAALIAPATASAAAPAATTGAATHVVPQSATVNGQINPRGLTTAYRFQYGPSTKYGNETTVSVAAGSKPVKANAALTGLKPDTTYHYRLVAENADGRSTGSDKTFTTPKQPLEMQVGALPNPVPYGGGTYVGGVVTGTNNAGIELRLESNPFPYTQGFKQVGNTLLTNKDGSFQFAVPALALNTQFRVVSPAKAKPDSEILFVGVAARVSTSVGTYRVSKGSRLTFSGSITPAAPGTAMALMRKSSGGRWVVARGFHSRAENSSRSTYKVRHRITRSGTYRVYAGVANGSHQPAFGREIRLRLR